MKTILITSGGTIVPIDSVRHIANMSTGSFGSKIAVEALKRNYDVVFLHAEGSHTPLELRADLAYTSIPKLMTELAIVTELMAKHDHRLTQYSYSTYDNYVNSLESILKSYRIDVAILAAAVSDYGVVNAKAGKIKAENDIALRLAPLPKVIDKVKTWSPTTKLVGFKLLVDASSEELQEAANKVLARSAADIVIGNDLKEMNAGKHKLTFFRKASTSMAKGDLAASVMDEVDKL